MRMWVTTFSRSSTPNLVDRKVRVRSRQICCHGNRFKTGKRVFKKPVKFLIKFVPTETTEMVGEGVEGEQNDATTFILTFVQTGGEGVMYVCVSEVYTVRVGVCVYIIIYCTYR